MKRETKERGEPHIGQLNLTAEDWREQTMMAAHFNGLLVGVVTSGAARLSVNYKAYNVSEGVLFLLFPDRLYHLDACSDDFKARCLTVSRDYMHEMDSIDMISRRAKYGARSYVKPVFSLTSAEMSCLLERIKRMDEAIHLTNHFYKKEMVLFNLNLFYLDLSNIIDHHLDLAGEGGVRGVGETRRDELINSFIRLLTENFREEHTVDYYARQLHLSTHYLTLLVKQVTGQSVSSLVYGLLFSEACELLLHSRLSVGEISIRLNFSDQSAFRKFFKRKSGHSPLDFRANSKDVKTASARK